jgi:hypothetical protein
MRWLLYSARLSKLIAGKARHVAREKPWAWREVSRARRISDVRRGIFTGFVWESLGSAPGESINARGFPMPETRVLGRGGEGREVGRARLRARNAYCNAERPSPKKASL